MQNLENVVQTVNLANEIIKALKIMEEYNNEKGRK